MSLLKKLIPFSFAKITEVNIGRDKDLSKIVAELWNNPQLSGVETHGGSYWLQIQ